MVPTGGSHKASAGPAVPGFTLFLWVHRRPPDYASDAELLQDALLLFKGRWGVEGYIERDNAGHPWGIINVTKFYAGDGACMRILGRMHADDYVRFWRGGPDIIPSEGIRYLAVRDRWSMEDINPWSPEGEVPQAAQAAAPQWRVERGTFQHGGGAGTGSSSIPTPGSNKRTKH